MHACLLTIGRRARREGRIVGSLSEIHSMCRPRPLRPTRLIRAALPFAPRRSAQLARRRQLGPNVTDEHAKHHRA